MNILIITTLLPYPLTSGGAQGMYNMIDQLRHKHNITLMFTEDRVNRLSQMHQLAELWPEVQMLPYRYLWQAQSPAFVYNKIKRGLQTKFTPHSQAFLVDVALRSICIRRTKRLKNFLTHTIRERNIDIVQIEFFPAIELVYDLPENVKTVFIQHEIHYVKNERYLQTFRLTERQRKAFEQSRKVEIDAMNAYDTVVTVTQKDKEILLHDGVTANVYVSTSAINTATHDYMPWNGQLTFVGGHAHQPNAEGITWLAEHVAPILTRHFQLNIIGKGWDNIHSTANLEIRPLGFVPELHHAIGGTIMLVPILTGSGMRMKILEAAASSVPFITTTVGVEGLDFKHEESCLIADTPQDFAAAIERLANDSALYRKLAKAAHDVYEEKYTVQKLAAIRDNLYKLLRP